MPNLDQTEPPQSSTGDRIHLVAKATISAVPIVGGPAAELFGAIVTPPLEKRRQEWMEQVAATLRLLESKKVLKLEDLENNEEFTSLLVQATVIAIRNHHIEKREALRNCVFNAASNSSLNSDIQLSFVRFVDELSPTHIKLLMLFSNMQAQISAIRSYDELYHLLSPDLPGTTTEAVFKMMCMDLQSRGLIWISQDIGDFSGIYQASTLLIDSTGDNLPRIMISQVGMSFLEFIAEPL